MRASPWEAVQDEAAAALGPLQRLADEADHNLVRHERARLHRRLGLLGVGGRAGGATGAGADVPAAA